MILCYVTVEDSELSMNCHWDRSESWAFWKRCYLSDVIYFEAIRCFNSHRSAILIMTLFTSTRQFLPLFCRSLPAPPFRVSEHLFCANQCGAIRHATKKAGGSTKNGRDSEGRRLGFKKFGGTTRFSLKFDAKDSIDDNVWQVSLWFLAISYCGREALNFTPGWMSVWGVTTRSLHLKRVKSS